MTELEKEKKVFEEYRKTIEEMFKMEHGISEMQRASHVEESRLLKKGWSRFIGSSALISIAISAFSFAQPVLNCG